MKYLLLFCLFTFLPTLHSAPPTPPKKPPTLEQVNTELLAKAALLADPLTGEVLYAVSYTHLTLPTIYSV